MFTERYELKIKLEAKFSLSGRVMIWRLVSVLSGSREVGRAVPGLSCYREATLVTRGGL